MKNAYAHILEKIPPSGIRRFFDLVSNAQDVISLGVGEPDFATPWNIREEAINSIEQGNTSYTSNKGLPELRELISHYMSHGFGGEYNYNQELLITVGVSQGIDITLRSILNPGDEVLIPQPCYVCYEPMVLLAGGKPVGIDTSKTGFELDIKELKKKITRRTKAILYGSPNNPTGTVLNKATLDALVVLAQKHNFWVIADEIYAELSYDEEFISLARYKNIKDRAVVLSGFSKAFAMTGWRIGFMCGPEELISRALKIHQYSMLCAPIMSQYAAIEALKNSLHEVKEMVRSYKQRRNFLVKALNEIGLTTNVPAGAFYIFPSIKTTGLNSENFALKLLEEERVALVPGAVFGLGGEGYVRACYAASINNIREAVARIKRFIKRM